MKALDGPLKGKEYIGVGEQTHTVVDHYRTAYEFYSVTYKRTDNGWKYEKQEPLLSTLVGVILLDPDQWSADND